MKDIEQLIQNYASKNLETKRNWYSEVASLYDWARPRYPQTIFEYLRAQLPHPLQAVEIGCGPGIATSSLASFSQRLIALEPSSVACEMAQVKTAHLPQVNILNTSFEEWQPGSLVLLDAVIATTSWHWLEPTLRLTKTAQLLRSQGHLVLLWNTPPMPSETEFAHLQPILRSYAPELAEYVNLSEYHQNFAGFASEIEASGLFGAVQTTSEICQISYSIPQFLGLL
ncbi:MAG: class I SAM-dependent methyltransferase, partial [Cyanobacteria bacterium P01_H01_bin.15]